MFTREYLLASAWYHERLRAKQHRDIALWRRHLERTQDVLTAASCPRLTLLHAE
jgi:hypothetical protein